jgi:DivIVA domain-containing protein
MAQPADTDLHRPLTAAELQDVTFYETRLRAAGYNEDEVDDFIDRVAGAVQAMHDRMTELEAENGRLQEQRDLDRVGESVSILNAARRTAEDTIREADEYNVRTISEAQTVRDEAGAAATEIIAQAEVKAAALAAQHADLEQHIAVLTELRNITKLEVGAFIQSLIDHLDQIDGTDPTDTPST